MFTYLLLVAVIPIVYVGFELGPLLLEHIERDGALTFFAPCPLLGTSHAAFVDAKDELIGKYSYVDDESELPDYLVNVIMVSHRGDFVQQGAIIESKIVNGQPLVYTVTAAHIFDHAAKAIFVESQRRFGISEENVLQCDIFAKDRHVDVAFLECKFKRESIGKEKLDVISKMQKAKFNLDYELADNEQITYYFIDLCHIYAKYNLFQSEIPVFHQKSFRSLFSNYFYFAASRKITFFSYDFEPDKFISKLDEAVATKINQDSKNAPNAKRSNQYIKLKIDGQLDHVAGFRVYHANLQGYGFSGAPMINKDGDLIMFAQGFEDTWFGYGKGLNRAYKYESEFFKEWYGKIMASDKDQKIQRPIRD